MNWNYERDFGPPVWSGEDTVYDFAWWHKEGRYWTTGVGGLVLAFFAGGAPALILSAIAAAPFNGRTAQVIADCGAALAAISILVALAWTWRALFKRRERPKRFLTRCWTLVAGAGELTRIAGQFSDALDPFEVSRDGGEWSVKLDAVARVEVGHTQQWIPARRYHGFDFKSDNLQNVPPHEVQTFLFMADGSRRVIYTGNSDLEGANALAHSVRSWLEEEKARAASQPRDGGLQWESERREGFDI